MVGGLDGDAPFRCEVHQGLQSIAFLVGQGGKSEDLHGLAQGKAGGDQRLGEVWALLEVVDKFAVGQGALFSELEAVRGERMADAERFKVVEDLAVALETMGLKAGEEK